MEVRVQMTIDEMSPNQITPPDNAEEREDKRATSPLVIILSVILILSMLTLLLYPILPATGNGWYTSTSTPTPTPYIWQIAANWHIQ